MYEALSWISLINYLIKFAGLLLMPLISKWNLKVACRFLVIVSESLGFRTMLSFPTLGSPTLEIGNASYLEILFWYHSSQRSKFSNLIMHIVDKSYYVLQWLQTSYLPNFLCPAVQCGHPCWTRRLGSPKRCPPHHRPRGMSSNILHRQTFAHTVSHRFLGLQRDILACLYLWIDRGSCV